MSSFVFVWSRTEWTQTVFEQHISVLVFLGKRTRYLGYFTRREDKRILFIDCPLCAVLEKLCIMHISVLQVVFPQNKYDLKFAEKYKILLSNHFLFSLFSAGALQFSRRPYVRYVCIVKQKKIVTTTWQRVSLVKVLRLEFFFNIFYSFSKRKEIHGYELSEQHFSWLKQFWNICGEISKKKKWFFYWKLFQTEICGNFYVNSGRLWFFFSTSSRLNERIKFQSFYLWMAFNSVFFSFFKNS